MNRYEIKPLEWDTKFFGIDSAMLYIHSELTKDDKAKIQEELQSYKFVTIKEELYLEENGFWITSILKAKLVDVNMQFSCCLKKREIEQEKYIENVSDIIIEECMKPDSQMIRIAEDSFIYSRFYNDEHIGKKNGQHVYGNWVKNSFEKAGKYFAVSRKKEKITGFVLFNISENILTIELICVDESVRRQHLGSNLLRAVVNYAYEHNIETINVGTQIKNIEAINFYFKNNFKIKSTIATYHLWMGKE